MAESHNRTLICSVLFVDIVEYSRKPVVEQIALKDRFNELLSDALRGIAVSDRIILDTGDGAAISFIGDPEDALFVAADLRDVIAKETEAIDLELATRMGVNLGPVRLVKDINGQPNIIGDGINVAQRVMSFAKPGQVLVSRSYYEVVSRLSEESSKLFTYEGSRTDKHIREHEVYGVGNIAALNRRQDERGTKQDQGGGFSRPAGRVSRTVRSALERATAKPRLATLVAVSAILVIALAGRMLRADSEVDDTQAAEVARASGQPASVPEAAYVASDRAPQRSPGPKPTAGDLKAVPQSSASETKPAPQAAAPLIGMPPLAETKRAAAPGPLEPKRSAAEESRAERPQTLAQPEEPAMISLAISPWGQVYVNGKMRGVSPPLQELELPPGRHRIEVRNNGSATHVVSVNAKPGERLRIKHKFE